MRFRFCSLLLSCILLCLLLCGIPSVSAVGPDFERAGAYAMVLPEAKEVFRTFSEEHPALDLPAKSGSPVLAADDGTVVLMQTEDAPLTAASAAYGNMIKLQHGDGTCTLYAHLDTISVSVGETVSRGEKIGTVGKTGEAEQSMLHFEVIGTLANRDPYPLIFDRTDNEQASLSDTQKDIRNGTKTIADFGTVTRKKLVNELQAHELDDYYLDTPYIGSDHQSPNGDISYNGKPGMNCAGFISYVLRKCGLDAPAVMETIQETRYSDWGSDLPYCLLSGASNYYNWAVNAGLKCYAYDTFSDLLTDGKADKGDLILYYVNQGWLLNYPEDNHLTIFWGDTPDEDLVWHQADVGITDSTGNTTNQIIPHYYYIPSTDYILIKLDNTDYKAPAEPVVTAMNDAAGEIRLTWKAVPGAVQYEIYRSKTKFGTYVKLSPTKKTEYTNFSVSPGNTFFYRVRAVSADGTRSSFSNIVSRTCRLPTPVVTAANVPATGKIKLTWQPVEGAVQYEIYRASDPAGPYLKMTPTSETTYTSVSITPGVKYYFRVRAVDTEGHVSAYASVAKTCRLSQPKVTFSNTAEGKNKLTWTAVEGATGYEIRRSTRADGGFVYLRTVTATQYINVSLKPGDTYYYNVRAVCDNPNAVSEYSKAVKGVCTIPSPTVKLSLNSAGKPKLTWNAVDGAVQYEIYRASSKTGTYTKLSPTSKTVYENPSAISGRTYYYKVRAVSRDGRLRSAFSHVQKITLK